MPTPRQPRCRSRSILRAATGASSADTRSCSKASAAGSPGARRWSSSRILREGAMKFGMVFPGQGAQSVGMLDGYGDAAAVREVVSAASAILNQDVAKLIAEGPAEELSRTVNTQPVMLTAGYAAYRLWLSLGGPEPAMVAGHSLGEYTALVAAGALAF